MSPPLNPDFSLIYQEDRTHLISYCKEENPCRPPVPVPISNGIFLSATTFLQKRSKAIVIFIPMPRQARSISTFRFSSTRKLITAFLPYKCPFPYGRYAARMSFFLSLSYLPPPNFLMMEWIASIRKLTCSLSALPASKNW